MGKKVKKKNKDTHEDVFWEALVVERMKTNLPYISHEEVWGRLNYPSDQNIPPRLKNRN